MNCPAQYLINDIYASIQGEGCLTGIPMAVVRLQGCSVGCPFCDTKETWTVDPEHRVMEMNQEENEHIKGAHGRNPRFVDWTPVQISVYIQGYWRGLEWVLLTGGEPAEQDLTHLIQELRAQEFKVAMETSGTADFFIAPDWVTVSPKINMPGGKRLLDSVLQKADEIKFVIGKKSDIDLAWTIAGRTDLKKECAICLQPMSASPKATSLCMEAAIQYGWRLSIQVHKLIGVP